MACRSNIVLGSHHDREYLSGGEFLLFNSLCMPLERIDHALGPSGGKDDELVDFK